MDKIKTDFDKIMAQFNDSVAHTAPKKFPYEYMNETIDDLLPENCRTSRNQITFSFGQPEEMDHRPSSAQNTSVDTSLNTSAPASPWESRRMKADLIEAKAMIGKFKHEIERQQQIRQEVDTLYDCKIRALKKQCEFSANKVQDLEKHVIVTRKREQRSKAELVATKNELNAQKTTYEQTICKLQRTHADIEDNSRLVKNSMSNEIGEYRRQTAKLKQDLELVQHELGSVKCTLKDYKEKASAYDELKLSLEKEKNATDEAKSKIKELEYEISSYGDWKEITRNSTSRLASIPAMDMEIERLKAKNKNLYEVVGDKLLLEEQVYDLKTRLEKYDNAKSDVVALQVKLESLEQELKEWVKVAQDHCLPNTMISPIALRSRIEQILQNDIIMTSEKCTSQCEKQSIESHAHELQQQVDTYTKNNETLRAALKHHKNIVLRVQKKLMLIAKERDCYKQLLENFEKDLTISSAVEMVNPESQLRCRIEMLEKTLQGYKEMCSSLEKELASLKLMPDLPTETGMNVENYDHFKKEIENLRMENERLKRRKEEVELELEHRCLKGDFNMGKYKVVHMIQNPAAEAYENANNRIEKLQAEIERLKRRNQRLQEEQEEMTTRLNETTNMTADIKDMNALRAELESMNNRLKKMKEFYKSSGLEFREVCYMLFGYKIDRIGNNNNYKISSMYAENANEYLNFRLNDSGILDMLETPYSVSLRSMMETQLVAHKSLPVFLSTLTLDLFKKDSATA